MSDEESVFQNDGQADTEKEYLPDTNDFKSDISKMYEYLTWFKRPSQVIEDAILVIEERLYYWWNSKDNENFSDIDIQTLRAAITIASSMSRVIESGDDERPPEFYDRVLDLIELLDLIR